MTVGQLIRLRCTKWFKLDRYTLSCRLYKPIEHVRGGLFRAAFESRNVQLRGIHTLNQFLLCQPCDSAL